MTTQRNTVRRTAGSKTPGRGATSLLLAAALCAAAGPHSRTFADEPGADRPQASGDAAGARAAEATGYLREVVEQFQVRDADAQAVPALQPRSKPLLTYNDPARGYLAAGVWRLGESGRPKGYVSIEYWRRNEADPNGLPWLSCEFIPIAPEPIELTSRRGGIQFRADGPGATFVPLPDGPEPAGAPRQRLTQMRNSLRRFAVNETYRGDLNSLRLMAQPIDRYEDRDAGIVDGGAFVFAYGTNPEMLVLLECDSASWRYAVLRMSWAESAVELDGRVVLQFPEVKAHPTSGVYQSASRSVTSSE
jgi:hypothetical protein